nr:hypothetical protein [Desulfobacterales bacterium]
MKNSTFIFVGRLVDGTGSPVQKDVLVQVENGLIVSLKRVGNEDPRRFDLVNLSHTTLLPPLVDTHANLFMSGNNRQHQLKAPFEVINKVVRWHLCQHLAHGVLAVRDGGDHPPIPSETKKNPSIA